ncbi:gephyrin-like molybdotransferase Glp [Caldisphaera sp.]|uniref:molybdopterin molybdotransferase MoeA n=1 Tax=Caldisphaera sp. TaxID=2060322 RepID=UPI0025C5F567|nr:gephyrin-like molybdotransferase Glp [Caldisphaera sp.]
MYKSKMKGFKELMKVEDALKLLFENMIPPKIESEEIYVEESIGKISYEDIISQVDIPPFNRSAVDGYAVISSDTVGASITNPISLKIVGEIKAGDNPENIKSINKGEAVIIYTGAPLPKGSDAVVMAEDATYKGDLVEINKAVAPYQNVSKIGEDFSKGKIIVKKNTIIKPWHIGAIVSAGIKKIIVQKPLNVAILSTGNEIAEPNEDSKGKIINSTKPLLKSMIMSFGCKPIDFGTVNDDIETIKEKIELASKVSDLIITTGGTSVGNYDLVTDAILKINGSKILFNGVRMRPGKPTSGAVINGKPIIMLSGFPVAAVTAFYAFIFPTINFMRNTNEEIEPKIKGKITRRVANIAGVKTYLRVKVRKEKNEIYVDPLAVTASGVLSTLTEANGLLIIPENVEGYDEDDEVEVMLI